MRRSTSTALARHIGVELTIDDWQTYGEDIPLLVNLQPAGEYLGEDYYHAGGVPAVVNQLMTRRPDRRGRADRQRPDHRRQLPRRARSTTSEVIRPFDKPLKEHAGFRVLRGNLFDSAIMKLSVISPEFRDRYLSNPDDPERLRGTGGRVRRAGGLSRAHRRSGAGHRRDIDPVHARRRADRLSGRAPRW